MAALQLISVEVIRMLGIELKGPSANCHWLLHHLCASTGGIPSVQLVGLGIGLKLGVTRMHGLELNIEAVRQIRGTSPNPVEGAEVAFVNSGPMVVPATNSIFGSEATL